MTEYTVKVHNDGSKFWYLDGNIHREDGPAIEWPNGDKFWYFDGNLHREDGPAVEYSSGTKEWHLNGNKLTEDQFNKDVNPTKELTVSEIEDMLGYKIKVVGERP